MLTIKFFDGNLGFHRYDQMTNCVFASQAATPTVMDLNFGIGVPTHFATRVTLTCSGHESYVIEDGPQAGQTRVTAGTLTQRSPTPTVPGRPCWRSVG